MEDLETKQSQVSQHSSLLDTLQKACNTIAPLWTLENFVAVNPFLGFTDRKFEEVAHHFANVGGVSLVHPISYYLKKIKQGKIKREDLAFALKNSSAQFIDVEDFIESLTTIDVFDSKPVSIHTLAESASVVAKKDWIQFLISRVSTWAAAYFDKGQATWSSANKDTSLFKAWKFEAEIDRTPEISGLKNFRTFIGALPNEPLVAAENALKILDVPEEDLHNYLHRLLLKVGGWAAHIARLDWENKRNGSEERKLFEFLVILLCWEAGILKSLDNPRLHTEWSRSKIRISKVRGQNRFQKNLETSLLLQLALEKGAQRACISKINNNSKKSHELRNNSKFQAVFCIDVRSEVFRRNLEHVEPSIETYGFAGFFAFPIKYIPLAFEQGKAQCPVLIKTGPTVLEEMPTKKETQKAHSFRVLKQQTTQIWNSFKSGAITSFSFVSPLGLMYLPKLVSDSFGFTRPVPHPDSIGFKKDTVKKRRISLEVSHHQGEIVGIPLEQRVLMAKNALGAMSLTENFGSFVLITGHGSSTVNNPHGTGLDCGACGGNTGEVNAKIAVAIFNDPKVRDGLRKENIIIPDQTIFLACLHDTTTDEVTIFNEYEVPEDRSKELIYLKEVLSKAGQASRAERAIKMCIKGTDIDSKVKARSKDWSQVRPEWGLAGCTSFIVAPRENTLGVDFEGSSFLHSYEWKKDPGFSVLELIMTAPMIVTSWINLQYYASTVDNKTFGAGNKTLHNVTSGIGVIEGHSGDLRVGLPMQSVHDGEKFQHDAIKLSVIIKAPISAMNNILEKHPSVKDLVENKWIYLLAMDEDGNVSYQYEDNYHWIRI